MGSIGQLELSFTGWDTNAAFMRLWSCYRPTNPRIKISHEITTALETREHSSLNCIRVIDRYLVSNFLLALSNFSSTKKKEKHEIDKKGNAKNVREFIAFRMLSANNRLDVGVFKKIEKKTFPTRSKRRYCQFFGI